MDKKEQIIKTPKERDNADLFQLCLELYARSSSQPHNKTMHDYVFEAIDEMKVRLSLPKEVEPNKIDKKEQIEKILLLLNDNLRENKVKFKIINKVKEALSLPKEVEKAKIRTANLILMDCKEYLNKGSLPSTEYIIGIIERHWALSLPKEVEPKKEVDLDELIKTKKNESQERSIEYKEGLEVGIDIGYRYNLNKPVESDAVELLNDLHCQLQNEHLSEFMESLMDRLDQFKQLKK